MIALSGKATIYWIDLIISDSISNNNYEAALIQIQLIADIASGNSLTIDQVQETQSQYLHALKDIIQALINISQEVAVIHSQTLLKLIKLGNTNESDISSIAIDLLIKITSKIIFSGSETLDQRISQSAVQVIDAIMTSTCFLIFPLTFLRSSKHFGLCTTHASSW